MSVPTKQAFIHQGGWDEQTRAHPALKFMENYTKTFVDTRNFDLPFNDYYTSDFSLRKGDGTEVTGGETAANTIKEIYGPFTENYHEPHFLAAWETEEGWEMIGQATVFANLVGQPSAGEAKVKDETGKEWDAGVPSGFRFWYAKTADGVRLKRTELMGDSLPFVSLLMKRGVPLPS